MVDINTNIIITKYITIAKHDNNLKNTKFTFVLFLILIYLN